MASVFSSASLSISPLPVPVPPPLSHFRKGLKSTHPSTHQLLFLPAANFFFYNFSLLDLYVCVCTRLTHSHFTFFVFFYLFFIISQVVPTMTTTSSLSLCFSFNFSPIIFLRTWGDYRQTPSDCRQFVNHNYFIFIHFGMDFFALLN